MIRQISLNGMLMQTELVRFDDKAVYIGRDDELEVVKHEDVVSLSKTTTMLNNRFYWKLEYPAGKANQSVRFRPNHTLWNRNFPEFHALLSKINPSAVKTPYHWWHF